MAISLSIQIVACIYFVLYYVIFILCTYIVHAGPKLKDIKHGDKKTPETNFKHANRDSSDPKLANPVFINASQQVQHNIRQTAYSHNRTKRQLEKDKTIISQIKANSPNKIQANNADNSKTNKRNKNEEEKCAQTN